MADHGGSGGGNANGAGVVPAVARAPTARPSFTVSTLRKAIPEHCFKRSLPKSCAYLVMDLVAMFALYACSQCFDHPDIPRAVTFCLLWPLYWFCQGAICTGLWVIAHECGHGAFSESGRVNDGVGLVLHTFLLVPYFSWKHSHRRHHSNTANVSQDEVFVPQIRKDESVQNGTEDFLYSLSIVRLVSILVQQLAGWPLYICFNVASRPYPRWANHFDPYSPIFNKRERREIVVSDLALLVMLSMLNLAGQLWGWKSLLMTYGAPLLVVNFWLVMITFLQHTHPKLPHYDDEEWDWLRGALATVDRDYGILNIFHHHIADTHVCHHLFSLIPHYHAQEATKAIRPILGEYYQRDSRNVFKALWMDYKECHFVAPDRENAGILWFNAVTKPKLI